MTLHESESRLDFDPPESGWSTCEVRARPDILRPLVQSFRGVPGCVCNYEAGADVMRITKSPDANGRTISRFQAVIDILKAMCNNQDVPSENRSVEVHYT